jgi:hypothetical protein
VSAITELLNTLITSWKALLISLILLLALFGVYLGVIRTLPTNTQEFKINGVGSIVLSQPPPPTVRSKNLYFNARSIFQVDPVLRSLAI